MNNYLLRVLSIRPFLFLWCAEVFSQVAVNMMNFVLIIVVFKLTHSSTAVAGVILSYTIPSILFGMLAGVYVDRWNKKRVLFFTNVLRMFFLFVLAFFHSDLLFVYFLSFVISIVTQFFIPAETPMIPLLVQNKYLVPANALFGMGVYGSVLIAYALSGPFLLLLGLTNVLILLGVFFFVAAVFVTLIRTPSIAAREQKPIVPDLRVSISLKNEIKAVIHVMLKTREIYQSISFLAISQLIILILAVIGPGFASQIVGVSVEQFPLLFVTPAALGMVVGMVLVGNYFPQYPKERLITIGMLISAIGLLIMPYGSKVASRGFVHNLNAYLPAIVSIDILHILMVLAFALGLANAFVFVPSNTILQEKTSDEFRGKVYGALNALIGVVSLLPVIIVGELADIFGVGRVLTGLGIVLAGIAVYRIFQRDRWSL